MPDYFPFTYAPKFEHTPNPDDICSLCGSEAGKSNMIECKDSIHICMPCADLLNEIKKERDKEKKEGICDKIFTALNAAKKDGNRSDMAEAVFDAIASGNIPHVRIV